MTRFGWLMAVVLAVALAACSQPTETTQKVSAGASKTTVTGKQLTRLTQNAAEMLQDYIQQVRDDYLKSAEAQLDRVAQRVERLQTRAEKVGGEVQGKVTAAVKTFNSKKDAARVQLEKLKASGDQPWETLKPAMDETLSVLEQELDQIMNLFG